MSPRKGRQRHVGTPHKQAVGEAPAERNGVISRQFRDDLAYWVDTDRNIALRCLQLVEHIVRDPFSGIGKPEHLRHDQPNTWSRRLTEEHRIVYVVEDDRVEFLTARYHYD